MSNQPSKSKVAQSEEAMIKIWAKEGLFEKSIENRKGGPRFRFYDGPPFTSGTPHYGHVEQSAIKDSVARYKTMQGYYVPRRTGCDTHGLPIENLVEKEHEFKDKQDIIKFGIDKFNKACREIVFRHKKDFDDIYERLGRWNDPNNVYATLDDDYMESVWWVFKTIYDKGLVYKGFKSMPYCPRCATPLSNFEVNDGYKDDVEDPSVYVKFKLKDKDEYMLAWTTTPWSLPGNTALAINPSANYVKVQLKDDKGKTEVLILAEDRLEALDEQTYEVLDRVKPAELVGQSYEPLFVLKGQETNQNTYRVWESDIVSIEDGTGVLHVAPAFGEDDLNLGQKHDMPVLNTIDTNGKVKTGLGLSFEGKFFKSADKLIIEELAQQGKIYAAETFKHTYPFCWRCETPLLYYAMPSWFVAVTQFRDRLVETGKETTWIPAHVKTGRFIKWLEGARDWAVSRNRFWGTPIPVWVNTEDDTDMIVVGSLEELRSLSGHTSDVDLHRPGIDKIEISKDGKTYRRIEEVFDCWFESGSMPYGQDHYPFENKAEFDDSFPAEFVVEAIEQVHLWFYTLHVLSTALFDRPAYKNVMGSGLILGEDGRKLSKRLRNYAPPSEIFDEFGADTLRMFILSSPLMTATDVRLSKDSLRDVSRNVFATLQNSYNFFTMYTSIDNWEPGKKLTRPTEISELDSWILARLDQTAAEMTVAADKYQLQKATGPLFGLLDDLSNWYIRRSRRRFWKSEDDGDKQAAYATLHYTLVVITQLLAPWAPFLSDELYRELTKSMDMPVSVHLSDWPMISKPDTAILNAMATVRTVVNDGLSARAQEGIKVRQPLADATVHTSSELSKDLIEIVAEELNVKKVVVKKAKNISVQLNTKVTRELKNEGLARDIIRNIQQARKDANLQVENRIKLALFSDSEILNSAITQCKELIAKETLATDLFSVQKDFAYKADVRVDGAELSIMLEKA